MDRVTVENYQQFAERTSKTATKEGCAEVIDRLRSVQMIRLLHGAMGLCTEAGELQDQLKRHLFYGQELDLTNIIEECGDKFWYLAEILTALDGSFLDTMQKNIDKLRERFPEKYTDDRALNRDLGAERKTLEG